MASWKDFENLCVSTLVDMLDDSKYRVQPNNQVAGSRRRVDISVAERRVGGRHFVFDAKHFEIAQLNKNEINTTEAYRRDMRGSIAVVLVSDSTVVPQSVEDYAVGKGVSIIALKSQQRTGIGGFLDRTRFRKDINWLLGQ